METSSWKEPRSLRVFGATRIVAALIAAGGVNSI
jgi:hypothetical protein